MTRRTQLGGVAGLVVAASVAVALLPLVPLPVSNADPRAFSSDRALDLIERLALEPHPMGSVANERVRDVIAEELRSVGLEPQYQSIDAPDYFGGPGGTVEVVNVLARLPGVDSTRAVAVVGHYDTVPTTPGANDNASAVAVMLEIARVLQEGPGLVNDVVLLFTDGEEPAPRYGSQAFVDEHPWFDEIGFVINLEALGSSGPSFLVEVAGAERWILDSYAESAPRPATFSFLTSTNELIGGSNTDFAPFRDAGVAGVDSAYVRGSSIYHTAADSPRNVGIWSLEQHGANTLALVERVGSADLTAMLGDSDVVFFTVGPSLVVRHGASWSLALVALSGVVLGAVALRNRGHLLESFGRVLLVAFDISVAATVVWVPLAGWRSSMRVVESILYLLLLAVGATVIVNRLHRRWRIQRIAAAFVWWMFAALLLVVPGIGYLFVWPTVAAAMVHAWRMARGDAVRGWEMVTGLAVVALVTLIVMVPAIEVFFQFANPRPGNPDSQLSWMIAIPALLLTLSVQLIRSVWPAGSETPLPRAPRESRSIAGTEV